MLGLLKKFKDGFSKTVSAIASKTAAMFGQKPIDASSLETLEEALISADFGVETTEEILTEIKAAYKKDKTLHGQAAARIGYPTIWSTARHQDFRSWRAITSRWISLVPSPMVQSLTSR